MKEKYLWLVRKSFRALRHRRMRHRLWCRVRLPIGCRGFWTSAFDRGPVTAAPSGENVIFKRPDTRRTLRTVTFPQVITQTLTSLQANA